ncbi:MAG: hypothetical protein AAGC67_13525 [Myxococcota bacterium]
MRRSLGSVFLCLALSSVLAGCGGPFFMVPGGALRGELATGPVDDWSFVDDAFADVEFRPDDPYSVELNYFVKDGKLYLDPAEGRKWLDYLRADPRVRVRFGTTIYERRAVLVEDAKEREGFDPERFVYRLDPR